MQEEAHLRAEKAPRAGVAFLEANKRANSAYSEETEMYHVLWAERNRKMTELARACERYQEVDRRRLREATA